MKIVLTPFHFSELLNKGYSLDVIFMLQMVQDGIDLDSFTKENVKIAALYQTLVRKGLITETNDYITIIGHELLNFMNSKLPGKIVRKKGEPTDFNLWWKAFPSLDTFEHKGKKFQGCRSLRIDESNCRIKFDKILSEGEYTASEMIEALKYDVFMKKEASVQKNENKLSYMQASLTYLNQRSFEPFIDLIRVGINIIETPKIVGGTDI